MEFEGRYQYTSAAHRDLLALYRFVSLWRRRNDVDWGRYWRIALDGFGARGVRNNGHWYWRRDILGQRGDLVAVDTAPTEAWHRYIVECRDHRGDDRICI